MRRKEGTNVCFNFIFFIQTVLPMNTVEVNSGWVSVYYSDVNRWNKLFSNFYFGWHQLLLVSFPLRNNKNLIRMKGRKNCAPQDRNWNQGLNRIRNSMTCIHAYSQLVSIFTRLPQKNRIMKSGKNRMYTRKKLNDRSLHYSIFLPFIEK